jgi:hypothetical protein
MGRSSLSRFEFASLSLQAPDDLNAADFISREMADAMISRASSSQ